MKDYARELECFGTELGQGGAHKWKLKEGKKTSNSLKCDSWVL